MTSLSRFILLSGTVLALAACGTTSGADRANTASLTRQLGQPYYVNVSNIVVETKYNPLLNPKDVSSTMQTTLDASLRNYAQTRLKAAGPQGTLRFIIEDATLFQEKLPSSAQVGQWLGVDNKDRYTAVVKVALERDGIAGIGARGAAFKTERTLTMPTNVSLDERDARLNAFVATMLNDIDRSVTDNLANTMALAAPAPEFAPSPGAYPPGMVEAAPMGNQ